MSSQINNSLKRHQFAESIRQQAKQKFRQEIRQKKQKQLESLYGGAIFHEGQYKNLKDACYQEFFSIESITNFIKYSCIDLQLVGFIDERVVRFLGEVTNNIFLVKSEEWKKETLSYIEKALERVIKYEISEQENRNRQKIEGKNTEIGDLALLNRCFDSFIKICAEFPEFIDLWPDLASIENQQLMNYAWKGFQGLLSKIIGSLTSDDIPAILETLQNFINNNSVSDPLKRSVIFSLDQILEEYHLSNYDLKLLIGALMIWLNKANKQQNLNFKVTMLAQQTKLLQHIVSYLDRTEPDYKDTTPDLVAHISKFIAKVFCADDETCNKAYYTIMRIIEYLRSWLPAEKNVTKMMLEQSHRGHLIHTNHICTQTVLYALSNIVGTDSNFVQIFLKTDLYRTFLYLFPLLPEKCRIQIGACIYNMVFKNNNLCLNIMLETKLLQIILQMLGEKNQQILGNALEMTIYIYEDLDSEESIPSEFFTTKKLMQNLERIGVFSQCEKLIFHENKKICQLTHSLLEIFEKQKAREFN